MIGGVGLGWRPETAWSIQKNASLGFTEVIAESIHPDDVPLPLVQLRERFAIVPHGIGLSLGGTEPPSPDRLDHLARVAEALDAPLVSEHVSFCRAGGIEIGHLTAIPRTERMLEVLVRNVREAQRVLGVPLALENIATLFEWPDIEMSEPEMLRTLSDETGCELLLDLANLHANATNHGWDAERYLDAYPIDRIAYVHVAGGVMREGLFHDTHAHTISEGCLDLLGSLVARRVRPAVLLERDDRFPGPGALENELDMIAATVTMNRTGTDD